MTWGEVETACDKETWIVYSQRGSGVDYLAQIDAADQLDDHWWIYHQDGVTESFAHIGELRPATARDLLELPDD